MHRPPPLLDAGSGLFRCPVSELLQNCCFLACRNSHSDFLLVGWVLVSECRASAILARSGEFCRLRNLTARAFLAILKTSRGSVPSDDVALLLPSRKWLNPWAFVFKASSNSTPFAAKPLLVCHRLMLAIDSLSGGMVWCGHEQNTEVRSLFAVSKDC